MINEMMVIFMESFLHAFLSYQLCMEIWLENGRVFKVWRI